ncbi:NAD-dependent succinate-semialdehyde dehydrogenase [Actinoallomurus purpureus]|uniref:NAD-dependent succinate-semialdehyde dehydrogenase n=1 Tax=Actinoallomurus purpureus TaxID=478114 RepID=UPI002092F8AF|nr:NAD-dependent succinate-semialdehyde dehydrogenase [Actinoallomurus purpureus]MCO6011576.1 NAD-dependent succinate-semialdehyde dehydrogenase [Actinoallomurus purpureus]
MDDRLYIGGTWETAEATFDVTDPSTGEVFASVADAGADAAVRALDAAAAAQASWAATAPRERSDILRRAYELMHERAEELARLTTREMGRPLAESLGEVAYAAEFLRWFSEEAVRVGGEYRVAPGGDYRILTTRQPIGPAYLVTPWNFPLSMITRKVGPAIAAGCAMIIKPAEATPFSALALGRLLADAGVPEGVLSVLPTNRAPEVTDALITDGRLRMLSFTGSTPVGRKLMEQAAGKVIKTTMELGGNAPFLVFDDADLDAALTGAVLAKMRNTGESCVAANRFIVHEAVAEEFAAGLAERLSALRPGPGLDPETEVGPLVDERARDRVAGLVSDALERGATLRTGGKVPEGPGWFYPPTVLSDVPPDARVMREEIFAPVAPVAAFPDEESMIAAANDTEAGLVAYAYTRDLSRALRVGEALEAGMVGLNRGLVSNPAAPFGGVKESGIGREGGFEGIDDYLELKYLAVDL